MNLKDLVPPLELCKKIPTGEFEDSALVWWGACVYPRIKPGGGVHMDEIWHKRDATPAPTLKEILRVTQPGDTGVFCSHDGDGDWSIGDCERDLYVKNGYEGRNPEELALRWWFEQKVRDKDDGRTKRKME